MLAVAAISSAGLGCGSWEDGGKIKKGIAIQNQSIREISFQTLFCVYGFKVLTVVFWFSATISERASIISHC